MEAILRITPDSPDIEILINDGVLDVSIEKKLSIDETINVLENYINKDKKYKKPNILYDSRLLVKVDDYVLIHQPPHKRYVTYSVDENKAFNINFPGCIYLMAINAGSVKDIEAYMYLEWKNEETELYKYGMPNMLSKNYICIGAANREVEGNNYIQTLENIIYAPYSHATLNNVKGFSNTISYFEYLTKNTIKEKNLYKAKKILKNIFMED